MRNVITSYSIHYTKLYELSISFFTLSDAMLLTITHLTRSMLILMVMWIVYNALATFNDVLGSIARHFHSQLGESLARLLLSIFKALVIVIGVVGVFQEWGFNVSAFLASLGLVGMAFALAAKDTASNLFRITSYNVCYTKLLREAQCHFDLAFSHLRPVENGGIGQNPVWNCHQCLCKGSHPC